MSSSQQDYGSLVDLAVQGVAQSIQHLTSEQLHELMVDDDKLDKLIDDCPQVKSLGVERELLLSQNKSLAEFNLSQEPKLMEAKEKLTQSYETMRTLKDGVLLKKSQLDSLADQRSLDTTLALLQTAAAEMEEESETVAESFLEGNLNVDVFCDQFFPKRSQAHLRRIKAEKLNEILRGQQYKPNVPQRRPPPPPNGIHNYR